MNHSLNKSKWEMNENGFTMAELLVGTTISLIMLALVAGIVTSQRQTFSRQSQLGQMQANGRASVDFVTRSVQNSGFNVTRGKRFLAASDHYITMVFDDDNDGIIQNDEVMTYAVSNPDSSTLTSFSISPYFDDDGDGSVDSSETRTYSVSLGLDSPPFHFYRITPDTGSSDVTKSKVARNIDNLIIRYWDKNGDALPIGVTTDNDGNPVPPYVIPADELNDIRKVEIEIVARSKDEDPNEGFVNSGTYYSGSVATAGGTTSYSDRYHRETYTATTSPRNLVTAPWGKVNMSASPNPISCPDNSTSITAVVLDNDGDGIDGLTVNFNTSEGSITGSSTTGGSGSATASLIYDWSEPTATATVSASTLIDVDGTDYPVFNAIPVSFESGTGIFSDNFEDGDSDGWTEEGAANWNVASGQYKTASNGFGLSYNGCASWQDYEAQVDIKRNGSLSAGEYVSLVLRYQDSNQYYMAKLSCSSNCGGNPNDDLYVLELVNYDTAESILVSSTTFSFDNNEYYTLKASVDGDELNAKFWQTSTTEPTSWDITATDTSYTQGEIAISTITSTTFFDNVVITPTS